MVKERATGASLVLADERLQNIFNANVLALLQLHDGAFYFSRSISLSSLWFRDAAPMVYALDKLGFHRVHGK